MSIDADISSQIGRRRRELGASLAQVARRAGTSAASLSRYEHGWNRFEVATLRKIASALDCLLRVELVPVPGRGRADRPGWKRLKRLFWDVPLRAGMLRSYPGWVAGRVLEYGQLEDVMALQEAMGRGNFLRVVACLRLDSARAAGFWRKMLEMEGIRCTKRRSRREVSNSWPR